MRQLDDLPQPVLQTIYSFLHDTDISAVGQLNRRMRQSVDDAMWEPVCDEITARLSRAAKSTSSSSSAASMESKVLKLLEHAVKTGDGYEFLAVSSTSKDVNLESKLLQARSQSPLHDLYASGALQLLASTNKSAVEIADELDSLHRKQRYLETCLEQRLYEEVETIVLESSKEERRILRWSLEQHTLRQADHRVCAPKNSRAAVVAGLLLIATFIHLYF